MQDIIEEAGQNNPDEWQTYVNDLARIVDVARANPPVLSTTPELWPRQMKWLTPTGHPNSTVADNVDYDMPNADTNDGEHKGARPKELNFEIASRNKTSEDTGNDTMDDTTDNLAENTVDNTADKTAKVNAPSGRPVSPTRRKLTKKTQDPTKLGSKSQPKSQLKPKKPTHADNYMTVMSITKATDGTVLSLKDIFDQVLQDITKFEYQTRQGTFGGSKLTTPSRADAVTYLKPFRELFGLEGMHNLMAILTDLRASFEIHKHFAPGVVPDATTANTCVLPNSIKHLPADDVRCMIFQKIVLVETMETGVTRARYEKIFALTELSNLYNKLTNAMSKAELERLGYESGRGRGHQTLVKGFLIDLIWPEDNSPASRERQRQRLTNQLSISGFYQALMAEFGRGVLLMVPDTWTIKRY